MAEPTKRFITFESLKAHNKPGDLWISIQGKVYDVSDWAKDHPGGYLPLLSLAGQDVTDAFVAYHPNTAWQYLDKFFNGYFIEDYSVSEVSKDYRMLVSEFSQMGLFEKKGHLALISFCFMALLFSVSVWGVLCCSSIWVHLVCGGLMGGLWIQSGWAGHDSGHYQIMPSKNLNRFVQILTGIALLGSALLGGNGITMLITFLVTVLISIRISNTCLSLWYLRNYSIPSLLAFMKERCLLIQLLDCL